MTTTTERVVETTTGNGGEKATEKGDTARTMSSPTIERKKQHLSPPLLSIA
jgi:hypothetical protein